MCTPGLTPSLTSLGPYSGPPPNKTQEYMDSLVPPSPDQFQKIAYVQEEKEEEIRRKAREQKRRSHHERQLSQLSQQSRPEGGGVHHANERADAARIIQKTFRGYRARRQMSGLTLDPGTRWITAIREAQFRETMRPRSLGDTDELRPSTARSNWKKLSMIARWAGHDDEEDDVDSESSSDSEGLSSHQREEREELRRLREEANAQRRQTALTLGLQYWLEIVDHKHRYGTNLRMYHEEWAKADTNENFFYWLDYGKGRGISLDTCPRGRLERDQVRYLSREERQYYLVTVDDQGRLCWAKNGEPVDTSDRYRDSICGIVPKGDPVPAYRPATEHPFSYAESASDAASTTTGSFMDPKHEQDGTEESRRLRRVRQISATTAFNKLLRKTVKDGTWIFVADTAFRLYVGIKQAGAFQHSSFLQGGRISAGGLISIKEGKLTFLSPLSGHYRPPTSNFRAFVRSLKAEGVDVGHVPMSKAYAVLLGLETYTKTRRMGVGLVHKMIHRKDKMVHPKEVRRREEEEKDTSKSAERERQVLAKEREEADAEKHANRSALKAMQKLHIIPLRDDDSELGEKERIA